MNSYHHRGKLKCMPCTPIIYVKLTTGGNDPSLTCAQKYAMLVKNKTR